MALPYQPQNLTAEQADGSILLTWTGALNATGYNVQRSTDGVNFTDLATTGVVTQYLDSLPGTGIMYWYQVAATNGSGTGIYSSIVQMVAAPPSEMSLFELRLRSQQTADRVSSQFVTRSEWNAFLRLAMYELYDLLITSYEDLFASEIAYVNTNGTTQLYPTPDGVSNFFGGSWPSTSTAGAPSKALYKLTGMDLGINTSNNAWVTLVKFNFIDRNKYVYPNSTSTIYGVYNMAYRMMGQYWDIIPTPAGKQQIRVWYSPKLPALLADTDVTTLGTSGWLRYPIVRAAKYALDKEESNTDKLDAELAYLKTRIEQASQNRDAGSPDTISNTRRDPLYGGTGFGSGGGQGGWAFAPLGLLPGLMQDDVRYRALIDSMHVGQLLLTVFAAFVCLAYFLYRRPGYFTRHVPLASIGNKLSRCLASLCDHVGRIIGGGSKEQVVWSDAAAIVAAMTDKQSVRDGTKMEQPRCSMGHDISARFVRPGSTDTPVPTSVDSCGVLPALALSDIRPKSFDIKIHAPYLAHQPGGSSGW